MLVFIQVVFYIGDGGKTMEVEEKEMYRRMMGKFRNGDHVEQGDKEDKE